MYRLDSPAVIPLQTGSEIPPRGLWAFDISFVDDQSQVDYLADASNASVDMINTRTDTLLGQIGGFRGFHGSRETQGPGGVLVDNLGQLWASDGDSTVKVVDLSSRTIVAMLHTGGAKRADEMAYDPQDQLLLVTNGSEAMPFATFISVTKRAIVGKLVFADASGGIEAPVFDAQTHQFYLSVSANKQYPGGAVAVVDPLTQRLVNEYPLPACDPSGIALDPTTTRAPPLPNVVMVIAPEPKEDALLKLRRPVQVAPEIPSWVPPLYVFMPFR